MNIWKSDVIYSPADRVVHGGKLYTKLDDGDNTAPDGVGGGWAEVEPLVDPSEFIAIETSLSSYEERVQQHQQALRAAKASAQSKLQALGLTVEELQAIGL